MPEVRELQSIDEVAAADWNGLQGAECPFLRHEFLAALEHHGCVGKGTGWTPAHLAISESGRLIAAAPVYRKTHSWGEFVFDFSWAQAYARHGLAYYPKLLCAVPFSPVNAARLLLAADRDAGQLRDLAIDALERRCRELGLSSAHALFISDAEHAHLMQRGWLLRSDIQFHWHNAGFADFDAYLATFRADKRKQVRRERRRVAENGIHIVTRRGRELSEAELRFAYEAHAHTFHLHGHEPYLSLAALREIAQRLDRALLVKLALQDDRPVAAAIFFVGGDALYGRYWGASGDFHSLHFELCYHQGIEFCIEHKLARFEPGTQGEHKIARGFTPAHTWSAHYIADPRFRDAIADFLRHEAPSVDAYSEATAAHTPFHRT